MDKEAEEYIKSIDESIEVMDKFVDMAFKSPQKAEPMSSRYSLKTIASGIIYFVFFLKCIKAIIFKTGPVKIKFSPSPSSLLQLKALLHRIYFGFLHVFTEHELARICKMRGFTVKNELFEERNKVIDSLIPFAESNASIRKAITFIRRSVRSSHPQFNNYLETIFKNSNLSAARIEQWKAFFDIFSLFRNKASHSNPYLTGNEKEKLKKANIGNLISPDGELMVGPPYYSYILEGLRRFLVLLYTSFNRAPK